MKVPVVAIYAEQQNLFTLPRIDPKRMRARESDEEQGDPKLKFRVESESREHRKTWLYLDLPEF